MKLAYLIPRDSYAFFGDLVPALSEAGIEVSVNRVHASTDLILAAILPITHEWYEPIRRSGKPLILWHWDLYSFTDYQQQHWRRYLEMLPRAAEVWSCSYETARQLKCCLSLDSRVMPAWVDAEQMRPTTDAVKPYVLYAVGGGSLGKRSDWMQRACRLLGFEDVVLEGQEMPRDEYVRLIKECRVYCMTAFEESNGSIPAMEAAAAGRPVVCAGLPSNREVFGDHARYFRTWDFGDCVKTLQATWEHGCPDNRLRNRVVSLFDKRAVFPRIVRRLREVHQHLKGAQA